MKDKKIVYGEKGGGGSSSYEAPNTLQAQATATILDLLCEGPIEGPAIYNTGDTDDNIKWQKSTFYNETVLMQKNNPDTPGPGTTNFQGAEVTGVLGEEYALQKQTSGFDKVENEVTVNTQIFKSIGPVVRTINDLEIDEVRITVNIPGLLHQDSKGGIHEASVKFKITIQGAFSGEVNAGEYVITGKTTSQYRKTYTLRDLDSYAGPGPWTIRLYRLTDDSETVKDQNNLFWYSYTLVKWVNLVYPDSVVVKNKLEAKLFGNQIPTRSWKIRGLHIKYPSNYTPNINGGGTYSGIWDGTFNFGYCSNPAWVVYDIITNERYGMGRDPDVVDKWALYSIGVYCDAEVEVTVKTRLSDGTYQSDTIYQPRFTFNGAITSREQAYAVLTHMCSVFRGFPLWTGGGISFVQDSPKSISRIASPANVIDGLFEYSGTAKQSRHTAVVVSYNEPENFSKLQTIIIEDEDAIQLYGYNPLDVVAFGCNNRAEAIRRARYILYTDINQTDLVTFTGGIEWADCLPGDVIGVQDPNYSLKNISGRIISATGNSITIDRNITIEAGATYKLYAQIAGVVPPSTNVTIPLLERTINNAPGSTNVLTWALLSDDIPKSDSVFVLSISTASAALREFQVMAIKEISDIEFNITAVEYNVTKYAEVEEGYVVEAPPVLDIPTGVLSPPSNILIQPYTYVDGDSSNRKYAMLISWTASDDPRVEWYELEFKNSSDGPYRLLNRTSNLDFDWRNVVGGVYDFRVKAKTLSLQSAYAYYNNFVIAATIGGPAPPTNLDTKDGGGVFNGKDCEIEWDPSDGSPWTTDDNTGVLILDSTSIGDSNIVGYKVEVYTVADVLLRTFITASKFDRKYIYTYAMNMEDNAGSPIRQIKFKVYTQDLYGDISPAVTLVASNPIPDMSSSTPVVTSKPSFLKVEWTRVNDNDMSHYQIYVDTFTPPTTLVGNIIHPDNLFEIHGLDYATFYYTRVVPYDGFGVGTASQVSSPVSPLQISAVNVDVELVGSIVMSTDSTYSGIIETLYDGIFDSTGITIANPLGNYIQYHYGLQDYFDRVAVWSGNSNSNIYIGVSDDGGTTWEYFSGVYLDGENTYQLTSYGADSTAAIANAWDLQEGFNTARLPNNVIASTVRMYFTNSNETVLYEFVPSRIIISELAAIQNLSAISANIGSIVAGNLQSSDYGSASGFNIDLDSKVIYMGGFTNPRFSYDSDTNILDCVGTFEFQVGSSGYVNLTDAPTSLNDISMTEYGWINDPAAKINSGVTTIEGGKITTGSITATQIGASQITALLVGTNEIIAHTANIKNAVVTGAKIASATIANANIVDATIETGKIKDLAVTTLKIGNNAVTVPVSSFTSTVYNMTTTSTRYEVHSVAINTGGGIPVIISGLVNVTYNSAYSGYSAILVELYRSTTLLQEILSDPPGGALGGSNIPISYTDTPGTGTITYYIKILTGFIPTGGTVTARARNLSLIGAKK